MERNGTFIDPEEFADAKREAGYGDPVSVRCLACGVQASAPYEPNVPRCPECGGLRRVEMEFIGDEVPK
jgi:DNA-directed RNA polymerase subunit RPC12/RpoP